MTENERFLFKAVIGFTLEGGGDGDGMIVSDRYKELADDFEKMEKEEGKWFISRSDHPDHISFSHQQEAIHFTSDRKCLPSWASADIYVEFI